MLFDCKTLAKTFCGVALAAKKTNAYAMVVKGEGGVATKVFAKFCVCEASAS